MTKLLVTFVFTLVTFSGSAVAQVDYKKLADFMRTAKECVNMIDDAVCSGSFKPVTLGQLYERKPLVSFAEFKRINGIPMTATKNTIAEKKYYLMGSADDEKLLRKTSQEVAQNE
jgi:hypothetical protein